MERWSDILECLTDIGVSREECVNVVRGLFLASSKAVGAHPQIGFGPSESSPPRATMVRPCDRATVIAEDRGARCAVWVIRTDLESKMIIGFGEFAWREILEPTQT